MHLNVWKKRIWLLSPTGLKALIEPYRAALADFDSDSVLGAVGEVFASDARIHFCHPFGSLEGPAAFFERALLPLGASMPDLERRDMIILAGRTLRDQFWIGVMGNYMGTFVTPFCDIPPTGHLAHMRYHEFFRVEGDRIVEMQAIWDIPELMMQSGAWPMSPQLGAYLCTPGPMSGDGLTVSGCGRHSYDRVALMLADLCKHPADPDPGVMRMSEYWHRGCNWYGPAGIGSARGIWGFRNWHQIPFLRAMPDRALDGAAGLESHWVSEGAYVCETGWPNMRLTLSEDGWMGIAPAGRKVTLRSLDFWRLEGDLIRENWVLVDILDLYRQIGVDVLRRMQEFNKARASGPVSIPGGMDEI